MGDFQSRIRWLYRFNLAFDEAKTPMGAMLQAAFGEKLHADANADEGPAFLQHSLIERRDHAFRGGESAIAIAKGADAWQNDPVGREHIFGIARDDDFSVDTPLPR